MYEAIAELKFPNTKRIIESLSLMDLTRPPFKYYIYEGNDILYRPSQHKCSKSNVIWIDIASTISVTWEDVSIVSMSLKQIIKEHIYFKIQHFYNLKSNDNSSLMNKVIDNGIDPTVVYRVLEHAKEFPSIDNLDFVDNGVASLCIFQYILISIAYYIYGFIFYC